MHVNRLLTHMASSVRDMPWQKLNENEIKTQTNFSEYSAFHLLRMLHVTFVRYPHLITHQPLPDARIAFACPFPLRFEATKIAKPIHTAQHMHESYMRCV